MPPAVQVDKAVKVCSGLSTQINLFCQDTVLRAPPMCESEEFVKFFSSLERRTEPCLLNARFRHL